MKKNKSKLKILMISVILLTSLISIYTSMSYAKTSNEKLTLIEESYSHQQWRQLSDEQRANTIEPAYSTITIKDSIKRSTYNNLLKVVSSVDGEYDLRRNLSEIIVKNQRGTGACWAFSATSVLETTLAKKYNKTATEYSPMHIDYAATNIYTREVGSGGNFYMLMGYLANGKGPVYEDDLTFESVYDETKYAATSEFYLADVEDVTLNQIRKAELEDATLFANIYKSYDSTTGEVTYKDSDSIFGANTYDEAEVETIRTLIKQHIQQYGAVSATCRMEDSETYFNSTTGAYYFNNPGMLNTSNHAATIVGWDDDYPTTNFVAGNQPLNPGAYIVLNSYGEEFGDNGYMYVSYDDARIEEAIFGIKDIKEYSEEEQDYDNFYTHSEKGMTVALTMINEAGTAYLPTTTLANVYTREDPSVDEWLTKVAVYLNAAEGVEIYLNPSSDSLDNLTQTTPIASYTGANALEAGYHTIDITPQELTGDKFVVAVKYIKNDGGANVPLECNYTSSGLMTSPNLFDTVVAAEKETYIATDNSTWIDLYGWQYDEYTIKDSNACIDAFTTEQEPVVDTTVHVTGVTLNKEAEEIEVGATLALTATVAPTDATNKNVTWTTSDDTVATVVDGVVTGVAEGTAVVTVTTEDGSYTDTCEITVTVPEVTTVAVTGVTLDKNTAEVNVGATVALVPTVAPANATNKNVTWTTSDDTVATVSGGVVTGIAEGTATITVTTEDGDYTAECVVTVSATQEGDTPVAVTGVTLDKETEEIEVGATLALIATVAPTNATNKNVTWTTSDDTVATVVDGVVTGVAEGTAVVTVTTEDGNHTDTCEVTVTVPEVTTVPVTAITLDKSVATIKEGETLQLVSTITPANATNKNVTWTTSDDTVATVSGGVVTGISEGTAVVTVTTEDGQKTATATITVEAEEEVTIVPVTSVSLNTNNVSLEVGGQYTLVAQINPTDATNKNVSWSSSNSSVVEVTNTGIITAKSEGTAVVTVTTEDGNKTATVTITVTKKTNTDDDIYTDPEDGKPDDTLPGDLPQTGESIIIITMIAIIFIAGIVFIVKFKKINLK